MLPSKKFKPNDSEFKFAKIHIPKMRSVFWKYFGFPANENDEIITKQKVVCTLCSAVLTNHYNTTNIRAHMQSTHKELFAELLDTHGIQVPPRKTTKKVKQRPGVIDCSDSMSFGKRPSIKQEEVKFCPNSSLNEEDSMNLLETIPLTYEDTDRVLKDDELSEEESTSNFLQNTNSEIIAESDEIDKKSNAPLNITVDINQIHLPIEFEIEEALAKMIVKDLQNISAVCSSGMEEFFSGLLANQVLPSAFKVESCIGYIYNEKFVKLKERIKIHSQVKQYSLSFDVWNNIENKQFVTIYFNNVSEEYENQVCDNLYMTVELNDYTMFEQIFEEFNLENCSAAVINCNHKILNTFLSNNDIPIIHCFAYIVNTCIEDVFKIPNVWMLFDEVQDIIARYTPEISSEDIEIPTVSNDFPLTKLNVLKFFCENISWPDEMDALLAKVKIVLDAISPLEMTLETLKEEDVPLSSLFLPFADKIMGKYFILSEYDDPTLQEIKDVVTKEFKRSVCSNNYLTVIAMLDPRFHKFLSIKNLSTCLNILDKKYAQVSKHRGYVEKCELKEVKLEDKTFKKSNLKIFFDCPDTPIKNLKSETLIEGDLRRYREEASASLDESPLIWWKQWGGVYGCLKYLADAYNCILGFSNMRCKSSLKDQISFHRKRFMLTGKLIDQIIFLNKNY